MKIYFAAIEFHNINKTGRQPHNILCSYWDWVGPIPFRKMTFKYLIPALLKEEKLNGKKKSS